jgi:branched-chain amino acid transport system substrate-binding protein
MKAADCDLVVLGTVIRETIGIVAESRKTGFAPTFLAAVGAYHHLVPKLGGPAMNGVYATMSMQQPYADDASDAIRAWAGSYKARFGEEPSAGSVLGWVAMDVFVRAATKAGPTLTTDTLMRVFDGLVVAPDIFGGPEMSWSATKRLGSDATRLSQVVDGRWTVVSGYFTTP